MKDKALQEKKTHVSLFKKDGTSYALALLSVLVEFIYVVSILDVVPITYWLGIAVMVNILILFLLFTCAVKINVYNKMWSVITFGLGIYVLIREFVLIPTLLQPYANHTRILILNLVCAGLLFVAGTISFLKCTRREQLQEKLSKNSV